MQQLVLRGFGWDGSGRRALHFCIGGSALLQRHGCWHDANGWLCCPRTAGAACCVLAVCSIGVVIGVTTLALIMFGGTGAYLGGAKLWKGALRVLLGGWLAMGITYAIGLAFNVQPGAR